METNSALNNTLSIELTVRRIRSYVNLRNAQVIGEITKMKTPFDRLIHVRTLNHFRIGHSITLKSRPSARARDGDVTQRRT